MRTLAEALADRWASAPAAPTPWLQADELVDDCVVLVGRAGDEHLDALAVELRGRGRRLARVAIDHPRDLPAVHPAQRVESDRCQAVICRETCAAEPLAHHNDRTARSAPEWLALDPSVRRFAAAESRAALLGWLDGLHAARWINEPWAASRSELKIRQLRLAQACGLRVPDTVVAGDEAPVREMAARHSAVVYKSLASPLVWSDERSSGFLYTSELDAKQMAGLKRALAFPGLFQERLDAGSELRVTVVGDRAFAVRLRADERRPDWRRALVARTVRYERSTLDASVERSLIELTSRLGLSFAGVDLIETDDGPVFLEVNAAAAYRWLEVGLSLPITAAICDLAEMP